MRARLRVVERPCGKRQPRGAIGLENARRGAPRTDLPVGGARKSGLHLIRFIRVWPGFAERFAPSGTGPAACRVGVADADEAFYRRPKVIPG